jgi:coiled-coil and C2 domain-containing protein 2A
MRWLGSLSIPLISIIEQVRLDGMFLLNMPHLPTHYKRQTTEGQQTIQMDKEITHNDSTYLHLYATVDPPFIQAPLENLKYSSDEPTEIVQIAQRWTQQLQKEFKNRQVQLLVMDLSGKLVFLSRYITPQLVPKELTTMKAIIRFVSLIPHVSSKSLISTSSTVWPTSHQFLQIGAGDVYEHAILACNLLKRWIMDEHLEKNYKIYIVLGQGIPEGPTAYVLIKESLNIEGQKGKLGNYKLLNPVTGQIYLHTDLLCSLNHVSCVFDEKNVSLKLIHE